MIKECILSLCIVYSVLPVCLSSPVVEPIENKAELVQSRFLSIIFQKEDQESNKSVYSFQNNTGSFFWNNRKMDLSLKGEFLQEKDKSIINITQGKVTLGSGEIQEFSMYAIYSEDNLTISYLQTKEFILKGQINLEEEPQFDLSLDIKGLSLERLHKSYGLNVFPFGGDFRGKINIKGSPDNIFVKGTLEAYQGNLQDYKFKKIFLNIEGFYPEVELFDSYAVAQNITFDLEGRLNLSDLLNFSPKPINESFSSDIDELGLTKNYQKNRIKEDSITKGFLTLTEDRDLVYKLNKGGFLRLEIPGFDNSLMEGRFKF